MPQVKGQRRNQFIAPIRGKRVGRYVSARVNREFRPLQREIQRQARQLRGQRRVLNQAYRAADADVRSMADQAYGASERAAQTVGGVVTGLAGSNQALAQRIAAERAAEAARRGGVDSSGRLVGAANEMAADLGEVGLGYTKSLASQGLANQAALLASAAANQGRKQLDMARLRSQISDLRRDRRDLAEKRGSFKNEVIEDLRERERDYLIRRLAFRGDMDYNDAMRLQAALGLQADQTMADALIRQSRNNRKGSEARAQANVRAAQINAGARKAKQREQYQKAMGLLRRNQRAAPLSAAEMHARRGQIVQSLTNRGIPLAVARRAFKDFATRAR